MKLKRTASLLAATLALFASATTTHAYQYKLTYFQNGTFVNVDPANPWGAPAGDYLEFKLQFWFMLPLDSDDAFPDDDTQGFWIAPGNARIEANGVTVHFDGPATIRITPFDVTQVGINYGPLGIHLESDVVPNPFPTDSVSNLLTMEGGVISYVDVGGSYNDAEGLRLIKIETVPERGATAGLLALTLATCGLIARNRKARGI